MAPGVEQVKGCTLGHKQDALELQLALHMEVLDGEVLLPVVGQALVEGRVLVLGDVLRVAHPNGLLLVDQRPLVADLLHLLLLLLLLLLYL